MRYELAKLDFIERSVIITTFLLTFLIIMFFVISFILFLSFSFAFYLGFLWNDLASGFFVVAGIYLIIGLLLIFLRRSIISRPVLRFMLKIMFADDFKIDKDE